MSSDTNSRPAAWLEPLPLAGGAKSLPCRILPGPMEGITDGAFCRVMAARGLVRAWVTPFIRLSTAVPRPARLRERLEPFGMAGENAEQGTQNSERRTQNGQRRIQNAERRTGNAEFRTQNAEHGTRNTEHETRNERPAAGRLPVIVQLMGTDIPLLAETARRVAELGAAGVDLNCACPSKVVVSNGAGGARLREPAWIREALLALRRAVPELGVSVKLRGGFADSATELPGILAAVREARPDFVMMHYRTVREEYRPVRRGWERLARAKALLGDGIPLLGAGDVVSAASALEMWRTAGVDGVTPARGLLRNPWLLREIEAACGGAACGTSGPALAERAGFLRELVEASAASGEWRRGFVLELARNLFGVDNQLFMGLATAADAGAMAELLARAAGRQAT